MIKKNLYKTETLKIDEKALIYKITQKEKLTEKDKEDLISILNKLSIEDLIEIFGKSFEEHTHNYVRWGKCWYEDKGLNKKILNDYFNKRLTKNSLNTKEKKIQKKLAVNKGFIYIIINIMNKKVYIGQTVRTLRERWNEHLKDARRGDQRHLYRSMRFYGSRNFKLEIIEKFKIDKLNDRERYWIAYYNSRDRDFGYNLTEGGEGAGCGKENHMYKEIDNILLKKLIKKGFKSEDIALKLNIQRKTVNKRIKQFWGMTLNEARNQFMNKIEMTKYLMKLKINNPGYKEIDENLLKKLIMKGLTAEQLASELGIHPSTVFEKTKELWGLNLVEARKYFTKPILKSLIKQNSTDVQIAQTLGISIATLYRLLNELWGMTLIEARKSFNKSNLELLIMQHKTAEEIAKELNISSQTVHLWVKKIWGKTLSHTWKSLIKPKLKSLIISHLNAEQIAEILHIDKSSVFHLTKEFWNKTLTQAWKTFIKIFLRSLIVEGFSAKEISKRLNVDFSTVYRLTKQFWNVRFSEAKDYLI